MSAYKHSPFPALVCFAVSRCIGTYLQTYPPVGGTAPGWAKYSDHKRSLCDGCISLSNAEGFIRCYLSLPCLGLCFLSWAYPPFLFARIRAYPICFIPVFLPVHTPDRRSKAFLPDTIPLQDSSPSLSVPIGHPPELSYTLRSEIPYQSISPSTAIHICHFQSLLSLNRLIYLPFPSALTGTDERSCK